MRILLLPLIPCLLVLLSPLIEANSSSARINSQHRGRRTRKARDSHFYDFGTPSDSSAKCKDGFCATYQHNHHSEGLNATSYSVHWNGNEGTKVRAVMSVPELPMNQNGICYYIYTDLWFWDKGLGRMNQFVPQLILGEALDTSSGPPEFLPIWHNHSTWMFGAHYFFELFDPAKNDTVGHAGYGDLYPVLPGEILMTTFEMSPGGDGMDSESPKWNLTMSVVGDLSRVSTLIVDRPYMGLGVDWEEEPTFSWAEDTYDEMHIDTCWELYGAVDDQHLPSSGTHYHVKIMQPEPGAFAFKSWRQQEGNGQCPSVVIREMHNDQVQHIYVDVNVTAKAQNESKTKIA